MIFSIFYQNVLKHPEHAALILSDGNTYTYHQAYLYILLLRKQFSKRDIKPGDKVGAYFQNEDLHVLSLLALDSMGAAYVPFDTGMPRAQLKQDIACLGLKTFLIDHEFPMSQGSGSSTSSGADSSRSRGLSAGTTLQFLFVDPADKPRDVGQGALRDVGGGALRDIEREALQDVDQPTFFQDPENICYIVSSSGTTAAKKWIPICGKGLLYWRQVLQEQIGLTPEHKTLVSRSPAFDARIFEYLLAFSSGGTLVLMSQTQRKSFVEIKQKCAEQQINVMLFISSMLSAKPGLELVQSLKQTGITHLFITGDAAGVELKKACIESGIHLLNGYGPTELTFGASLEFLDEHIGNDSLMPAYHLPIAKPWGSEVKAHIVKGKLYLQSPFMAPYYITEEGQKPASIDITLDSGEIISVFDTGDAFEEIDGKLYFLGRFNEKSHCKINGVKVTAERIKQCLLSFNLQSGFDPIEVEVILKSHQEQTRPFAYVVLPNKFNKDALVSYAVSVLSTEEMPFFIELAEIPRMLASDKVDMQDLHARQDNIEAWFSFEPLVDDNISVVKQTIRTIWCQVLNVNICRDDINFYQLGGTSLNMIELSSAISKAFSIEFSDVYLRELSNLNISSISATVDQLLQGKNISSSLDEHALIAQLFSTESSQEKIFLLPALLGEGALSYKKLVASMIQYPLYFGKNIYGLSDPGIYDENKLPVSFQHAITRYVNAIMSIQPKGPYYLMGFSYGATLAYGVADYFETNGEKVNELHLLDGISPSLYNHISHSTHFEFFKQLTEFLVSILNNHYGETLKAVQVKNGATLAPSTQISKTFNYFKKHLKHAKSYGVINIAQRHLDFLGEMSEPSRQLRVVPMIYFTRKNQVYLNIIEDLHLGRATPEYQTYCWRHYFNDLQLNMDVAECEHLGLINSTHYAGRYWQQGYYQNSHCMAVLLKQLYYFTPGPCYMIESQNDKVYLTFFFLTQSVLATTLNYLDSTSIEYQLFGYDRSYQDPIRKDWFFSKTANIYCTIDKSLMNNVYEKLSSLNISQVDITNEIYSLDELKLKDMSEQVQSGSIDLLLGLTENCIYLTFHFKVKANLTEICQAIINKLALNVTYNSSHHIQFFKPLSTTNVSEAVAKEAPLIRSFTNMINLNFSDNSTRFYKH